MANRTARRSVAPLGQRVAVAVAGDEAVGLHRAQALGQQVRRDPRQTVEQLAVAARAGQQLAHHEDDPPIPDHVEAPSQPAVLAVRAHTPSLELSFRSS
jgi:hypothetical protein